MRSRGEAILRKPGSAKSASSRRARTGLLALLLLLAGCIPGQRASFSREVSPSQHRQCLADLAAAGVKFEPLPDRRFENGCAATQAVKLVAIGTPVTNLGAMRCPLARAFVGWVQEAQALSLRDLGTSIRKLESYGTFACRPVNNVKGNRLSEHAFANAIDIAGFQLADGRRVTVRSGWTGPDETIRTFLRNVHRAGCRRFGVVLGPDANAYHADHLHFDMGKGPYCR